MLMIVSELRPGWLIAWAQVGRGPIVTEQLSINSDASWHFIDAGITDSELLD